MMKVNTNAKHICRRFRSDGFQAFIVGGAVRDMIAGREPKDWDIVTSAPPSMIKLICSDLNPIGIGEAFGIITVTLNGEQFEIATFRADSSESDGRRPDSVKFVNTIEEDLARRDFTMNAIAFDPVGEIMIDPFAGGLDIADKNICFVGNAAERIEEDRLRILRGLRFGAQFGFTLDEESFDAIRNCADPFKGVSQERITAEFCKILTAQHGVETIALMAKIGILQKIIPEIQACIDCQHESPWHHEIWGVFGNSVFAHILHVMNESPKTVEAQMAALLHDIGKPKCKRIKTE